MSYVTSVILQISSIEDGFENDGDMTAYRLLEIQEWLKFEEKQPLSELQNYMLKGKHPQTIVLGGGYNYFPVQKFVEFILNLKWKYPEQVVLLINTEEFPTTVFRPKYE